MNRVRLVRDWESPDIIYQQTPGNDGIWDDIHFTFDEVDEFDYLIVFNRVKDDLKFTCCPDNIWLTSGEPPNPAFRWQKKSYRYFSKIFSQHKGNFNSSFVTTHGALPWQIEKTYMELLQLSSNNHSKMDKLSFVTSNKNWMEGHRLRLQLIKYFRSVQYDYDLYGRGFNQIENKFDGLYPYKYSIAIENSRYNHYWTDKIADCFLSWTLPFYYGAPNIYKYFPKESIILINPNRKEETLDIIKNAVRNRLWDERIDSIREARELILNKYQFFPFMSNEIKNHQYHYKNAEKKNYTIPRNIAPWEKNGEGSVSIYRKIEWKIRKLCDVRPY